MKVDGSQTREFIDDVLKTVIIDQIDIHITWYWDEENQLHFSKTHPPEQEEDNGLPNSA